MNDTLARQLPAFIVDRVDFGIFAVDADMKLLLWNRFMQFHSGRKAEEVIVRNLFECFPDLPRKWLEKKFKGVFLLKNFSFTSWEQRPYLLRFGHDRPVTGGTEFMHQDCTFMPLIGASGEVEAVCVTLFDVTDTSLMHRELERAMAALKESANRDGLTGVFNRRHLEERLAEEFARYKRYGDRFSFLLFDLDRFKSVNDRYGHLAGDAVLREAAARVSACVRKMDVFGRYGGEEFALLLPATDLPSALIVAEKVRRLIGEQPIDWEGRPIAVTASVGVNTVRPDIPSYEALIGEADRALYDAKEQGRNRSVVFKPEPG